MTKAPTIPATRDTPPRLPRRGRGLRAAVGSALALSTGLAQTPRELAVPNYLGTPLRPPAQRADTTDPADLVRVNTGMPYRAPAVMPRQDYNIRLGLATANFFSSLSTTFNDNAFGAPDGANRVSDLSFFPSVGMSLRVPLSERQAIRFDVGVGYRISVDHPELNALIVSPSSSIDYRLIIGDVLITFFNTVSSASQPPPQVAGSAAGSAVDFARLDNNLGVSASWMLDRYTSLSAGYGFMISRGFDDSFGMLDADTHSLTSAIFRRLHPYWTAGVSASYGWTTFQQNVQNGSTTWSVGPVLAFEPSPFLNFSLSVGYTSASFDQTGTIGDTSTFGGLTYSGSVSHRITQDIQHSLSYSSGINAGIGSNFSESTGVTYGVSWAFHPRMSLHAGAGWTHFKQSGSQGAFLIIPGANGPTAIPIVISSSASGENFQFNTGTGLQLTPKLSSGLNYSYMVQSASFGGADFDQHAVTLTLSYAF